MSDGYLTVEALRDEHSGIDLESSSIRIEAEIASAGGISNIGYAIDSGCPCPEPLVAMAEFEWVHADGTAELCGVVESEVVYTYEKDPWPVAPPWDEATHASYPQTIVITHSTTYAGPGVQTVKSNSSGASETVSCELPDFAITESPDGGAAIIDDWSQYYSGPTEETTETGPDPAIVQSVETGDMPADFSSAFVSSSLAEATYYIETSDVNAIDGYRRDIKYRPILNLSGYTASQRIYGVAIWREIRKHGSAFYGLSGSQEIESSEIFSQVIVIEPGVNPRWEGESRTMSATAPSPGDYNTVNVEWIRNRINTNGLTANE